MKQGVFFPYGVSNFEQLATQGFVFVDKTPYLEKLEYAHHKFVSYLRPRRFGKSLFVSVLEYYYDLNQKHKFEKLFGKYYIGQNPTQSANSYRILKFDFSGIDTSSRESAKQGFNLSVLGAIEEFFNVYQSFNANQMISIRQGRDAEEIMYLFFRHYPKDIPIYFIIDEYDHFTNEILYRSVEEFKDSVSKQGYVRKFYEVIKTATQQGVVDRLFVTGVSPVTLDSLTSGFNILKHLTHDADFEVMMGFSEEEVRSLLNLVLRDKTREEEIIQEMKLWYNGYRFNEHSVLNIYNSDMVLYYLDHFKDTQTAPKPMLDINIAPDYGKLKQMFRVINVHENKEVLQEVLENGYVNAPLTLQFNFERDFGRTEFINFLAYMGNLTIKGLDITGRINFGIPNRVIEELYWQYYADVLSEYGDIKSKSGRIDRAIEDMARSGNYEAFFKLIEEVLQALFNRDFIQFSEKQVKMVIIAYLMMANIFFIISEQETQGGGYPDLFLFKKPNNPYEHHQFVIELKYLKQDEADKLAEKQSEAKTQLLQYYQQDSVLQSKKLLHLLTVVAIKNKIFVEKIPVV